MEIETIRAHVIRNISDYAARYRVSVGKALEDVAHSCYHFSVGHHFKIETTAADYRDRFSDFVIGNPESLTSTELEAVAFYYGRSPYPPEPSKELIEQLRGEVEEIRAEDKRLLQSTAYIRHLMEHCFPISILKKIRDFVYYYKRFKPYSELIFFANLYAIGYIDGKREERRKRKAKLEAVQNQGTEVVA